jgi:dihydroorotate dehydrogenase
LKLGFGFTEIGTVTPKPQAGNPKPRIFRLVEDEGVINRLGFNNEGHEAAFSASARDRATGIIGVNIGANKDSDDRIADYVAGIRRFYSVARYFTANISSPNTPGLRDLQARESLSALLSAVLAARDEEATKAGKNPGLPEDRTGSDRGRHGRHRRRGAAHALDGLIVSNTTLSRDGLKDQRQAKESRRSLRQAAVRKIDGVLAKMRKRVGPDLPIIGVGGVSSAKRAWKRSGRRRSRPALFLHGL